MNTVLITIKAMGKDVTIKEAMETMEAMETVEAIIKVIELPIIKRFMRHPTLGSTAKEKI